MECKHRTPCGWCELKNEACLYGDPTIQRPDPTPFYPWQNVPVQVYGAPGWQPITYSGEIPDPHITVTVEANDEEI